MRALGYVIVFGLVIRGGLWVFGHEAATLTVVALAVGAYLAARFLVWLGRGFACGFRRRWGEMFPGHGSERPEERYSPR